MKKSSFFAVVMAACLAVVSCGETPLFQNTGNSTSSATSTAVNAGSTLLNSLLGSLLSTTLNEQSLYGTWTYIQPEVRFESENLLAKAGGEVAAASIESKVDSYLSKIGIKKGSTTYTFNEDKTFSVKTGSKTILSGTYTFNASTKALSMTDALGLTTQNATVGMNGTNLCLLFEASKLLSMANTAASILGKSNATAATVASVIGNNYNGMKVGFAMAK